MRMIKERGGFDNTTLMFLGVSELLLLFYFLLSYIVPFGFYSMPFILSIFANL